MQFDRYEELILVELINRNGIDIPRLISVLTNFNINSLDEMFKTIASIEVPNLVISYSEISEIRNRNIYLIHMLLSSIIISSKKPYFVHRLRRYLPTVS